MEKGCCLEKREFIFSLNFIEYLCINLFLHSKCFVFGLELYNENVGYTASCTIFIENNYIEGEKFEKKFKYNIHL